MAVQLQFVALFGFAALMLIAAIEDLRRLIIPNALIVALCLLWPLSVVAAPNWLSVAGALAAAILVFLVGALAFSRGWLGGGDVKLLAAAALWAGPGQTPSLLVLTGVLGGMLALFLLMPPGAHIAALARVKFGPREPATKFAASTPVPYGIAIAAAAMLVIFLPHFR
jgi:prepilin peptidase CpaA